MAEPLKNLYNDAFVSALADSIVTVHVEFDRETFRADVFNDEWDERELKARSHHIAACLRTHLPDDYEAAINILLPASQDARLADFTYPLVVFSDFVEDFGLEHWDVSVNAMETFTAVCTSEFAVRPFIEQDCERMMSQMLQWTQHPSEHVRRLAGEGCRPRLPWGGVLTMFVDDPAPIFPILEALKQDSSEYVRRSVANNLNDITKDHPQQVIDTLKQWHTIDTPDMQWVINHALRTLVKAGDSQALELLGYPQDVQVTIENLSLDPVTIQLGDTMTLSFDLQSKSDDEQNLMVDYIVHHVKANGTRTLKVFKLKKMSLAANEAQTITKQHSIRPISTRKYYAGVHRIEIQINGQVRAGIDFELQI